MSHSTVAPRLLFAEIHQGLTKGRSRVDPLILEQDWGVLTDAKLWVQKPKKIQVQ